MTILHAEFHIGAYLEGILLYILPEVVCFRVLQLLGRSNLSRQDTHAVPGYSISHKTFITCLLGMIAHLLPFMCSCSNKRCAQLCKQLQLRKGICYRYILERSVV